MKKIKSIKTILKKNHKKRKKTMWGNTIAIFNVKKKNYKAKFSTNFILKKIKSTKIILKKKHKKTKKKTILIKKQKSKNKNKKIKKTYGESES